MAKKVLASSAFIGMVAIGLPLVTSSGLTGPAAASPRGIRQSAAVAPSGCAAQAPASGEHCLPLPGQLIRAEVAKDGGCGAIAALVVPLVKSVVQYDAIWVPPNAGARTYSGGGLSPGVTSSPGAWTTGKIVYGNVTYKVPKGSGAWFLGAGGGAGPCTSPGPGTAQAWGWTARPVVSGYLTFKGSGPAPGIKVKAGCASGGTTTTDSTGAYGFVLDRGACTISPIVPAGEDSDPHQRVVNVADQDITHVDFVVPGGALKVYVKKLEPLRSGLAVHSVHYSEFPADFTARQKTEEQLLGGSSRFVCQSGCTDITVSVIDPATGKAPAPHATVDASLSSLQVGTVTFDNQVTTPKTFGSSFLCTTGTNGQDKDCGTSLHGLETDADGQVHLRYWAPGVLASSTTTLSVTASCDARPCQASQTTADLALTIKPYEIYQHSTVIPDEDVVDMAEWAGGASGFDKFLETSVDGFDVLKHALTALEQFESAAKLAKEALEGFEAVEPIAIVLDVGLKISSAFEAQGMFALFLEESGLSPFGIGADPSEGSVSGDPTYAFVQELMNQLEVPSFLKVGNGGFWWAGAQVMREDLSAYGATTDTGWSLDTTVYEVSHCTDAQNGECGPGYRNAVGAIAIANNGVQPELVIELTLSHNHAPIEALAFSIQYDALAWTTTQPDLKGVIQDH